MNWGCGTERDTASGRRRAPPDRPASQPRPAGQLSPDVMLRTASRSVNGTPRSRSITRTLQASTKQEQEGGQNRNQKSRAATRTRTPSLQASTHPPTNTGWLAHAPLAGELSVDAGAGGHAGRPRALEVGGKGGEVLRLPPEVDLLQHRPADVAHDGCERHTSHTHIRVGGVGGGGGGGGEQLYGREIKHGSPLMMMMMGTFLKSTLRSPDRETRASWGLANSSRREER